MKKKIVILSLISILGLVGCTKQSTNNTATATDVSQNATEISQETEIDNSNELSIADYIGNPYKEINGNVPYFTDKEKAVKESFETYSDLDELGRCGVAYANIGRDIMPTEKRGEIGHIKPSGWHTSNYNEYKGLVDGNYLYNRCHLIAYMLAGENDNEKNLITGTRYMNVTGMLPFEDKVHDYMNYYPENHVLYRVTPVFNGNNLVADGVLMEAYSIEDNGKLEFCVFCYNVQPYIDIDYATGENHISNVYLEENNITTEDTTWEDNSEYYSYVLNENSKKIHTPECTSIEKIKDENKTKTNRTYDELISEGYTPCSICHPE